MAGFAVWLAKCARKRVLKNNARLPIPREVFRRTAHMACGISYLHPTGTIESDPVMACPLKVCPVKVAVVSPH